MRELLLAAVQVIPNQLAGRLLRRIDPSSPLGTPPAHPLSVGLPSFLRVFDWHSFRIGYALPVAMTSHKVKFQSVTLEIQPWKHPSGREYWRAYFYENGRRKTITRATLADAKRDVLEKAIELARGTIDLNALGMDQIMRIRRMLDADPSLALVDEFLVWHGKRKPVKDLAEARAEFLAAKKANKGRSSHNVDNLARHLKRLPNGNLADIAPADLPPIAGASRTRRNVIAAWVTFFRWCQKQGHLPHGEPTAPERLDRPIVTRSIPGTWQPVELEKLLANVASEYLPWLALAALAGLRTEEVHPDPKSDKDGVRWEDFQWARKVLIIRPEVAKTGHRRVVPILPALRAVLWSHRGAGRVGGNLPPHTPQKGGKPAETTRLGKLVGGWRRNALRHSFISYRAAEVGLAQTSMEAGNSESEARASYNDAKSKAEAKRWFAVRKCSQKPSVHKANHSELAGEIR